MTPTNRTFKNVETNDVFRLFTSNDDSIYHLIHDGDENNAPGTRVNGFYISAHCAVDIKLNGSKIVHLPQGTFYNLKEGEAITHKKYPGFKKFTKV
jgi:hypothetical protein